jgi:peptidoglycan/LPS O-acetylase OafA/YrhL
LSFPNLIQRSNAPLTDRLHYLDGWRALAISGVIIGHFGTAKGINLGRLGVELFFVLSGRLMAQILFIENSELGKFYFRRFTRVYPTIVTLILGLVAASWFLNKPLIDAVGVVSCLTYTFNYVSILGYRPGTIDHLWSLCIEEHTYVFLGLLALMARRWPHCLWFVLIGTMTANVIDGAASTYLLQQDYYVVYWRTDVRMASILMGVAAFMLKHRTGVALSGIWPIIIGLVGIILNVNMVPDPVKYSIGTACLAASVATVDEAEMLFKKTLSSSIFVWVGLLSFSLYIWQQPFAMTRAHPVILRIVPLAAALACAVANFYLIERPARRWLNVHPPRWALNSFARKRTPPERLNPTTSAPPASGASR